MKRTSSAAAALAVVLFVSVNAAAQSPAPPPNMAAYWFGLLKAGPQAGTGSETERARVQQGHRANMQRMADAGLLVGAGPVTDGGSLRGVFIFKDGPREKLDEAIKQDPAISSGRLVLEMHQWWGPKGIGNDYFAEKRANPSAPDRMVTYQLALLLAGPNRAHSQAEAQQIQDAHMAGIRTLGEAGKLVAAGPFVEDSALRGIFVFNVSSVDEAKALTDGDAAVKAGRLVAEVHPWLVAEGVIPKPK